MYEPYELQVVQKAETDILPVYYTINQNGVMRILNDKAAKELKYIDLIKQKRALHPQPPTDPKRLKMIFQKPTIGEDSPESYLTKR